MIYAKLTEELKSAPKTDNPEYTIFLRNLVMSYELNDLYEYFVPIIEDPDIDKEIRFSAYYSCSIYFRRNNKFEEMIKLADNYARYFINYALNDIVLSFKYRYTALSYSSSDMMYKAISYAYSAKKKIEHHKAILHHYAETIATGLDHDFIGDEEREGFIQEAINAINESIELWNTEPAQIKYAKNYATLGRLYIHKCEYDMGSYYITKALNYENGDNKDSLNRIIKYNNYLYNVSAKYSYGFPNPQDSSIIVAVRYLDYFTTMMEDRLWQVIAKPVFLWQNRSGLLMNAARAA